MPDGSYSISDIQDYFEYIINKHDTLTKNLSVLIYVNRIKSRIVFRTKTDCKIELLSSETMKLLESTTEDVDQDKDGEDVPKLQSFEVILVYCNLLNNNYQQASKLLFTFVSNKQFGQLIDIAHHSLTLLNTSNTEFSSIEVWFTDENSKPLDIEDNVNMMLIIR